MTNYTQSTNFATKDALTSGDPLKILKGTEINTEFANIAIAVATKADLISPTFVTPALGTPASGVMTNVTGLPLTTGVTGTLPVANGGTGVTASTGSGSVVLSTSPTLVTPALGTPASGNLANCTFPTLNQNTTGSAATVTTTINSGATGTTQATSTNNTTIATTAFVQAVMQTLHPVGSIYTATVATNPGTLLGFGTWSAFAAGRVMIGNGGGFSAGATGGSADAVVVSHNHTATSTVTDPSHSHVGGYVPGGQNTGSASPPAVGSVGSSTSTATTGITVSTSIDSAGVSGTNANLQPYIVVYMWTRTA